ncbi:MAG: NAD(P)-dependent oxidoreductase [Isosphaeraceae bacterium]|nr:NAD(P)-dependent oxidoreductase [Isosphaeraceae bacterium]
MKTFRIALTGDFLDESGAVAQGDAGLPLLAGVAHVEHHFIREQAPTPGDPSYWDRYYSLEVTADQIAGVHGLVVLRPYVKARMFERGADDLVVIGRSGAGYDKVDVAACTAHDVALFNAPRALNHSTASAALLLMLALAKRLPWQERITRQGRWDRQHEVIGSEIQGRTLGIIGLGNSGRELARLVAPFAMTLLSHSPHADPAEALALGVTLTTLAEVMRQSDFVSIHCRLAPETRGLIGRPQLALMKPTACLINVARGENVDQPALVDALRSRAIAGAGLDVFDHEPLPIGDPLLELDNVIVTPHWLASTTDVWQATGRAMALGMLRAARGLVPEDVVNTEVLERPGFRAKLERFAR